MNTVDKTHPPTVEEMDRRQAALMAEDEPNPERRYVTIHDGFLDLIPQSEVSRLSRAIDFADCYGPIEAILTLGRDGKTLVEVRPREASYRRINTYAEQPFRYAATTYETAEGDFCFTVTHTDH